MQKPYDVKSEYKDILIKIVKKHIPECTIYLFGSRSRKTNRPRADIDIAIDAGKSIAPYTLSLIKESIEESKIPFFVDVVDFHTISQEMKKQIQKEKIEWNS